MAKLRRAVSPTRKLAAGIVRDARHDAGLSQEAAELRFGVSARTIGAMERGEVPMLALELVIGLRLAAASQASDDNRSVTCVAVPRLDKQGLAGQRASSKPTGAHREDGPGPRAAGESTGLPKSAHAQTGSEARSQDLLGRAANFEGASATRKRRAA
jgi:DNA-binding XRE family transcriptional regulator